MKIYSKILLITLFLFSANSYSVEITPLFGYRTGGEFIDDLTNKKHTVVGTESYGIIIGFPYEFGKTIEVYYSHQSSNLNSVSIAAPAPTNTADIPLTIDYLHIGGTAPIQQDKNFKTFVSGGLGFTYLSPDFVNTQSDLRASFSIGIGLLWPITETIALRLETRGFATIFNSNAALFCSGGCALSVNGSLFFQAEVFAGLAFKF
jgi:hypothetical protein